PPSRTHPCAGRQRLRWPTSHRPRMSHGSARADERGGYGEVVSVRSRPVTEATGPAEAAASAPDAAAPTRSGAGRAASSLEAQDPGSPAWRRDPPTQQERRTDLALAASLFALAILSMVLGRAAQQFPEPAPP